MTGNGSFLPVSLTTHLPVSLALLCLPPLHFSPFNSRVLLGSLSKQRPNSSALKISSNLYFDNMVGRWVSLQGAVICSVHIFFSPDTVLNLILFRVFHLSTHPFNALKLAMSSFFTKPFTFSWRNNPLTGMLLDRADINYLKTTLSNCSYFPALTFFLFRLIIRDENAAIIFSLFPGKSHVETMFLGTPYFPATNDLGFIFSISLKALNLFSVEVIFFCCFLMLWKMTSAFFLHYFKYETLHTSNKPQNIWIFQTF